MGGAWNPPGGAGSPQAALPSASPPRRVFTSSQLDEAGRTWSPGSFSVGIGVLWLEPRCSPSEASRERSGTGSLPDLRVLPEIPAACFCLPVTQVLRSGQRKGPCLRGPGEQRLRKRGPSTGRLGARAAGRQRLPSPSPGSIGSLLQQPPCEKTPPQPLLGCRGGGPRGVAGTRAECGAA